MSTTFDLELPEIAVGQAQKEVTHNQSLWIIDALCQANVIDYTATKPTSKTTGDCYLIATGATGSWSGHVQSITHYYSGTWHYYSPATGWTCHVNDVSVLYKYNGSSWAMIDPSLKVQSPSYATAVTINWNQGGTARIALTGTCTIQCAGAVSGQRLVLIVDQDATGNRKLVFGSTIRGSSATPSISLAIGKSSYLGFIYNWVDNKYDYVSLSTGF